MVKRESRLMEWTTFRKKFIKQMNMYELNTPLNSIITMPEMIYMMQAEISLKPIEGSNFGYLAV